MVIKDYFFPLLAAWEEYAHRMPDYMRTLGFLGALITRKDTVFVKLSEDWIVFIGDGDNITVMILGNPDPKAARKIFRRALDATRSVRLTAFVPSACGDYFGYLREVGFKHEGRIRKSQVYDGEQRDALVLGFLANAKKGRKRKRRSRRGK